MVTREVTETSVVRVRTRLLEVARVMETPVVPTEQEILGMSAVLAVRPMPRKAACA